MSISSFRVVPPRASAMVEALRGLGYSPSTSIADIIDNSVSAGAETVDLLFGWSSESSTIAILDDGAGMDDYQLEKAMRLGDRSPLESRTSQDLGRFGLGLKTASFSQCRRLTVASRRDNSTHCLRWDLDLLTGDGNEGWRLFEGPADGSESLLDPLLDKSHGTLVIWEKLDRIITTGFREQDYLDLIDRVERHLGMVFHRFLARPRKRLQINVNRREVRPWDPFLISHPATWSSPVGQIPATGGNVEVQAHVLPHRDRLTPREHESAAGSDGWTSHQGFYVYRNERLLVAGSWLGLGRGRSWTKEEAHRLARIRLDITNSADSDWKIDIKKSVARPPVAIRDRLTRLSEDARERARRVFAHRGRPAATSPGTPLVQAWRADHFAGGMRYRIDREHPAVRAAIEQAAGAQSAVEAMLRILEETIPVQRIWLDTTEASETPRTGFAGQPPEEVRRVLLVLYDGLVVRKGYAPSAARELLARTEPFNAHPELVAALPDIPQDQDQ